jgi:WD40 repeat protein
MTANDPIDGQIGSWLRDEALAPAPIGRLERTLTAIDDRRPRPAWTAGVGAHWVGSGGTVVAAGGRQSLRRSAVVALVLLAVALVAGGLLLGAQLLQPAPDQPLPDYHLAYGLDGDVIVADWDGSKPVVIADGDPFGTAAERYFWAEDGAWSPDGRYLVYHGGAHGGAADPTVYVSDPAGNVVTSFPGTGLTWSPDSTKLATWAPASAAIEIRGINGELETSLPLPADTRFYGPVWSPGGSALLLGLHGPGGDRGIWRFPFDGSPPQPLLVDGSAITDLVFSPDSSLAFVAPALGSAQLSPRKRYLVRVIGDASGLELASDPVGGFLEPPPGVEMLWSPTGHHVAYPQWIGGVSVVDLRTGETTRLSLPGWMVDLHAWSPEGDRLLCGTLVKEQQMLWSVGLDGSPPVQLVSGTAAGDWQ